jgi:GNAT superfamily N-acetyltransferase
MFTMHREIFHDAFRRQEAGENLMLVADCNGFPVGQIWVDFARKADESVALVWALRVHPLLQNRMIGARLLAAAEKAARRRHYRIVELGVEKHSEAALRFYRRHGYEMAGEIAEQFSFTPPGAEEREEVHLEEWVLRKPVAA